MWSSASPPPFHSTLTISTSPKGVHSLHYELSPGSSPRGGTRLRRVRFSDPESPSLGEQGEEGQQEQSSDQEGQASPWAEWHPVAAQQQELQQQQQLWWLGADQQASGGSHPAAYCPQGYPPQACGG